MKNNYLKYGNLVAFIVVAVLNILAATGILGGVTTRDVSYMYKSLLTPADYAFSIWSLIYILIAVMVYLQLKNDNLRDVLWYWFIVSCVLNAGWILAWQFKQIALSFVIILALLIDLIILMKETRKSNLLVTSAVGLYTGWINVAMLANLGALFRNYSSSLFVSGISSKVWAIFGLCFGIIWISGFLYSYRNIFYALGACWGYFGIVMASDIVSIEVLSLLGIAIFAGIGIFLKLQKKNLDVKMMC